MTRVRLHGSVAVALPPDQALALFTPRGETAWVPGWEPRFPAGDGLATGTTFLTHEQTIWVIAARSPSSIRYARVTPNVHAGTVEVRCKRVAGATRAHVTYDLTALGDPDTLDRFAGDFDAMLAEWERLIAASLEACAA